LAGQGIPFAGLPGRQKYLKKVKRFIIFFIDKGKKGNLSLV
jgi:hypothetical protein